jgi:formate hydrogenlyase subunit 3/multisubunit Na+/H+ antiporter MnhD subunit
VFYPNIIFDNLLIVAFGGALLTYLLGKISRQIRNGFAVILALVLVLLVVGLYDMVNEIIYFRFFNHPLMLRINTLAWFFAIAITVLSTLSIIFSLSYMKDKSRLDFYYLMMLLVNASMLGIVLSGDLISFYIFWEIMSWSIFLLVSYNKGPALAAGLKYIIISLVGSLCMLVGILSLYAHYGTFEISQIALMIAGSGHGYIVFILLMFCIAFGIKNGIVPLHTWVPSAYSESPSPFTAVLSGMLAKMGTFGFLMIFYILLGWRVFLYLGQGVLSFHYILCIIAAITIVIPNFIAVLQDDAKKLLAWSSIGQCGYIILGIAFGTSLGLAGGIFHFFNHAIFKALLFLAVGAVEFRTNGVRDLNSLGGLVNKMPVTFMAALVGACGLIGIPLTNGFVSKWLIYKTLILKGSPFLAFAALLGTWGSFLAIYKLLHNMFLGQISETHKNIKRAPFGMQLPMVILSIVTIVFGILPGLALNIINSIGISLGFESLGVNLWGISSETGTLNTINIFAAIIVLLFIVYIIFRTGAKSVLVSQENSYAAGSYVPKEKYHYTVDFYNPFFRMVRPWLRDRIDQFYSWIGSTSEKLAELVRRIYTGDLGYYVIYIILFVAVLIFAQLVWRPW